MIKRRILLLAPDFYSLHTAIISELERLNFNVIYIPDKVQKFNPYFSTSPFKWLKKYFYKYLNPNYKYIKSIEDKWNGFYDIMLVINGYSFHEYILDSLRIKNPQLKTILYLWDGLNFYDFTSNFKCFDSIYTFDSVDAKEYGIKLQPLFWVNNNTNRQGLKYDLCFIGTSHSDRSSILEKIIEQCSNQNISSFIKLVVKKQDISKLDYLRYLYHKQKNNPNSIGFVNDYQFLRGWKNKSFLTTMKFTSDEYESKLNESKCVLDIELPYQSGVTHRMIEALARKKKIITTNTSVKDYLFYNPNNIYIIDRTNPFIDKDFFDEDFVDVPCVESYINELNIKEWIIKILEI